MTLYNRTKNKMTDRSSKIFLNKITGTNHKLTLEKYKREVEALTLVKYGVSTQIKDIKKAQKDKVETDKNINSKIQTIEKERKNIYV